MKKLAIILACMLACFTLFTGCKNQKDDSNHDTNLSNSVEINIPDEEDNANESTGSGSLPDGFAYEFKDPDNADGIVVTPRK